MARWSVARRGSSSSTPVGGDRSQDESNRLGPLKGGIVSQLTDPRYLRTDQYKDASNLNARIEIHRRFSTNDYPWQRWVFDHLNVPRRSCILDVGCGPAHLWLENKDRIPVGWTVMLGDLSSGMVRTARHNLGTNHDRFRYQVLDAHAPPSSIGVSTPWWRTTCCITSLTWDKYYAKYIACCG